jgi:hypothetical protein
VRHLLQPVQGPDVVQGVDACDGRV